jgi:hypothetical protein
MNKSHLLASILTVLSVFGLVAYRLLWAASSVASATALGRMTLLPKSLRRWLLGEQNSASAKR